MAEILLVLYYPPEENDPEKNRRFLVFTTKGIYEKATGLKWDCVRHYPDTKEDFAKRMQLAEKHNLIPSEDIRAEIMDSFDKWVQDGMIEGKGY